MELLTASQARGISEKIVPDGINEVLEAVKAPNDYEWDVITYRLSKKN